MQLFLVISYLYKVYMVIGEALQNGAGQALSHPSACQASSETVWSGTAVHRTRLHAPLSICCHIQSRELVAAVKYLVVGMLCACAC